MSRAVTNLAMGSHQQVQLVYPLLPDVIHALSCGSAVDIKYQSIWALGNIASDCDECRSTLMQLGCFDSLVALLYGTNYNAVSNELSDQDTQIMAITTWTLCNLIKGQNFDNFLLKIGM